MLLWHMGAAAVIVYVTLGRARIDYRWILVGAIAPDLIDGLLNITVLNEPSSRGPAHSLAAVVLVALVVLVATRGERRLSLFGLAVGWLLHLVVDGMWAAPQTFLWPAFGAAFSDVPGEQYTWDLLTRPLVHWSTWATEAMGAAILAWFWIAFRLGDPERRRRFLRDGHLRA
jgi:hypothetical protein